jgi:hypothetical protein
VAASLGLEPRQRDPESLVLPLHHEAKAQGTRPKAEFARFASGSTPTHSQLIQCHLRTFARAFDLKIAFAFRGQFSRGLDHLVDHLVIVRRVVVE